jgi:hypothetical protein
MSVEIVTKDDLQVLRMQLVDDMKAILAQAKPSSQESQEGYKTKHVRKLLGCCNNKLVALRVARKLRTKKVGGTIYYNKEDVRRLLEEGY